MRNLISMFMILALVITTTFVPSISHAMPHGKNASQTQVSQGEDCHHHGEAKTASGKTASGKTAQNDKEGSGKCCDKGMCKCIGGNCHNGLSKIFSNSTNSLLAFTVSKSTFGFADENTESAYLSRLKRPPKA